MKSAISLAKTALHVLEKRYCFSLPASLYIDGEQWNCRLVNLSRSAARIDLIQTSLPAGSNIWLAIAGWPRLSARLLWQSDETAACVFAAPLRMDAFVRFLLRSTGEDRDGDEIII